MSGTDAYSRGSLRRSYTEAWRKHLAAAPLTALEASIADVVAAHPEYQALITDEGAALAYEPGGGGGTDNPFLHLGLHLAVREQVATDRPPGIRELHRQLRAQSPRGHAADHALMQALGETLWEAQSAGRAPDEQAYLARARRQLR